MAVDDVFKLTVTAQGGGGYYQNTYSFRSKTEPALTTAAWQTVADATKEIFRVTQRSTVVYQSWRAVQVYGAGVTYGPSPCERSGGSYFEGSFTGTTQGGASGDALPPQSAMVVTLNSGKTGRRFRGRVYAFGQTEVNQDDGLWIASHVTAITTAWNTYMGLVGPTGSNPNVQLGIFSERIATGCVPNPNPPPALINVDAPLPAQAFTPVVSFTVKGIVYNQRRRTRGVGR
jgi:hypothetical protein